MLAEYIKKPALLDRAMAGIGGLYLPGYVSCLDSAGYRASTVCDHVLSVARFIAWATAEVLMLPELDEAAVEGFAGDQESERRLGPRKRRRRVRHILGFIHYLRQQGVVPAPRSASERPEEPALLVGFRAWMLVTRGVRESTLDAYCSILTELLESLGDEPGRYDAAGVRDSFRSWCRDGRTYVQNAATAVRMFLRFLSSERRCSAALVAAVPRTARWSQASLPRYLSKDMVERVIQATARSRNPLRNRAILLLLHRLAFRAGDIVRLRLQDVAWQQGTVRTCGKGRAETEFPLTQEVGEALEDYVLRERPAVKEERVFLRGDAPFRPLGSRSTVSALVRLEFLRAKVTTPSHGAHILRHTAATQMLRDGASMTEVATILRHRSVDTTMVYAKVDTPSLKLVAQPWPKVSAC